MLGARKFKLKWDGFSFWELIVMRNFKTLNVWSSSLTISKHLIKILKKKEFRQYFDLKNQIFKSSISIPSNIAEGCSRSSNKEFRRYLEISLGSAFELETQLLILNEIASNKQEISNIITNLISIQKILFSLIKKNSATY